MKSLTAARQAQTYTESPQPKPSMHGIYNMQHDAPHSRHKRLQTRPPSGIRASRRRERLLRRWRFGQARKANREAHHDSAAARDTRLDLVLFITLRRSVGLHTPPSHASCARYRAPNMKCGPSSNRVTAGMHGTQPRERPRRGEARRGEARRGEEGGGCVGARACV